MNINLDEIQVKVKVLEQKDLKAIIGIDFGDFSVKGFRVRESRQPNEAGENLWLTPPSYKDMSNRYHPIFYIPDINLWKQLEEKIMGEYHKQTEEFHRKQFGYPEL